MMKLGTRTMMAPATLATMLLVAGVSGHGRLQAQRAPDPAQRVGGLWVLHEEDGPTPDAGSDADEDRPPRGDGRPPGGHGGGMGGFGGFGGFGGRPGERPDESLMAQRRSLMALHRRPTPRFTFVVRPGDGAIVLTDADGHVRTLLLDGKKYREPLPDGGAADRVTRWKDGVLISELRGNGIKLVHSFRLDATGDALVVTSTLEVADRDDRKSSLRRVYARGDAGGLD
jgi:hypothetical protein